MTDLILLVVLVARVNRWHVCVSFDFGQHFKYSQCVKSLFVSLPSLFYFLHMLYETMNQN